MSKNKMLIALLCLLALVLTACGGGEKGNDTTAWTTEQMAAAILAAGDSGAEVNIICSGEDQFSAYVNGYYRMEGPVEEGTILYAGGVSALEVAVFRLGEGADTGKAQTALQDYIEDRAGAFTGYAPEEAAILDQSNTAVRGRYVALLICPNQEAAQNAFASAFQGGEPPCGEISLKKADAPAKIQEPPAAPETPEPAEVPAQAPAEVPEQTAAQEPPAAPEEPPAETPDEQPAEPPAEEPAPETPPAAPAEEPSAPPAASWQYDQARLVSAWEAGDWSGLEDKDRAILDKCKEVIDALITDSMSDYAKELAVHDWIIAWVGYDQGALDNRGGAGEDPDNDNPYGLLVSRKGICFGYTSTFQLFMDLVGVECVTVSGTARNGTTEHGWNMVKLDGEWYAVDVTWDDPITSSPFPLPDSTTHMYFNVTSSFLRSHDHQWDESAVEEAKGTKWCWNNGEF